MHINFEYFGERIQEENYLLKAYEALDLLLEKKGPGSEFTGWVDLPVCYDKEEFRRIEWAAKKIRKDSDVLICIGIGGSYLGARAAIEALTPLVGKRGTEILYAGNHLSSEALEEILEYIQDKEVSLNVISKSGTTTEPAIAFRILRTWMEEKYGKKEAARRIFATTDKQKGALRTLAQTEGYETFVIPDEVGGRYSVLTAVGLLPIATAGIDIAAMMEGAAAAMVYTKKDPENPAVRYAVHRYDLYHRLGKQIEILVQYDPHLVMLSEWWKQLYGESDGKEGQGLWPASASFTTDLHSLGQMIQEGERNLFETVIFVDHCKKHLYLKEEGENLDGLNYLAGKTLHQVNEKAFLGVKKAHLQGGVPQLAIHLDYLDPWHLGYLFYFFELSCGIGGYMNGINPFDQPGVEAYKTSMFRELKKPGYF